ncbi:MAG: cobalamin B12-binding domain-containing protein [Solirubrobacteraceae bacterium]
MAERLLPDAADLPSGALLVEEGLAQGARIEAGRSAFCQRRGVASEVEFKRSRIAAGELQWSMIMGLASLADQIEALGFLDRFGEQTGVVIDRGLIIPNWVTGLPERLRERAPKGTSFVLGGVEDHVRIAQAAAIMPCFNDFHIGSPAAVPNTLAAIQAGGSYMGVLAQYVWSLPYMDDDVELVAENVKAIAIVAQKWSDGVVVDSYLDDGMPAEFADNVSMVGYACLERHVVERLCGARYATGFGQLISDIPTKLSIWLALAEVLKADHPPLSYLYGNTIDASDTVITGNYGISAAEIVAFAATERRYRTGVAFLPNPITEKLQVPTVQEIADIHAAARSAADKSRDLEGLLDFSAVEADRDVLVEQGTRFFENALRVLAELGVDVSDPLQMLLGVRRLGAQRLEQLCHPGQRDDTLPNGVVPFSPTEFTKRSTEIIRSEVERIRSAGIADVMRGQPFIVGSADTHVYGKFVVAGVLRALGAEVVDAGVDRDPEHFAALLRQRHDRPAVAISTHNGQCVSYTSRLMTLLPAHNRPDVFIGGKLNTIADGDSEPSDASHLLREMGAVPCSTIADLVGHVAAATRA